jgi:hypothetical protein
MIQVAHGSSIAYTFRKSAWDGMNEHSRPEVLPAHEIHSDQIDLQDTHSDHRDSANVQVCDGERRRP